MARTVTLAASTTTPKIGQPVHLTISVANTDANPVQVSGVLVYPTAITASCNIDQPDLGAGGGAGLDGTKARKQTVINSGATLVIPSRFVGHQPQVPGSSALGYQLNAVVTFSDGQTASGQVTVNVSPLA